jgi:hypothetical protein
MLTRSQVALRIGRSIATVRRMEGRSLHPTRDAHGVHWFDPRAVEEVLEDRAAGSDVGARSLSLGSDAQAHLEVLRRLALDTIEILKDRELRALPAPIVRLLDAILE